MTLSGDLPEKRGAPQPNGSIEGCRCKWCQDARAEAAQDSKARENSKWKFLAREPEETTKEERD